MNDVFAFIAIALATFYASHTISQKEGPFSLFARLREALGVKESVNGTRFAASAWGRLVGCPICLAPYCAVALWLAWVSGPGGVIVVDLLAYAGMSSWLELVIQKK